MNAGGDDAGVPQLSTSTGGGGGGRGRKKGGKRKRESDHLGSGHSTA